MSIDLASILIGVLAIVVSVVAGVYAAGAISSEYIAKITSRLIALEHKIDLLLAEQSRFIRTIDDGSIDSAKQKPPLLDQSASNPEWEMPKSEE